MLPDPPRPTGNVFVVSINALRTASGSMVFWVLVFTFFVCGVSSFGLTPHFVTLCGDFSINPMISTSLLHGDRSVGSLLVRSARDGFRIDTTIVGCSSGITIPGPFADLASL